MESGCVFENFQSDETGSSKSTVALLHQSLLNLKFFFFWVDTSGIHLQQEVKLVFLVYSNPCCLIMHVMSTSRCDDFVYMSINLLNCDT